MQQHIGIVVRGARGSYIGETFLLLRAIAERASASSAAISIRHAAPHVLVLIIKKSMRLAGSAARGKQRRARGTPPTSSARVCHFAFNHYYGNYDLYAADCI